MWKSTTLGALTLIALSACTNQSDELAARRADGSGGNLFTSSASLDALRKAPDNGTEFERSLRQGYLQFASREIMEQRDYVDGDAFAKKGLAVGKGKLVLPEEPQNWPVDRAAMPQLVDSRNRLVKHLDAGARDSAGKLAGTAQALYDCWVEEEAEGYQPEDIAACRGRFEAALKELDAVMAPKPAAVASATVAPPPPREYRILFDFDKSTIRPAENATIQQIAAAYAAQKFVHIEVVGHTDTAGRDSYNLKLSRARATAVANALARLGVDRQDISMSWTGEQGLAVATGDNQPEEQNRRVSIITR